MDDLESGTYRASRYYSANAPDELTAPDRMNNLYAVARPKAVIGIAAARDNFPVNLDGQPAPGQAEFLDQLLGSKILGHLARLTVD